MRIAPAFRAVPVVALVLGLWAALGLPSSTHAYPEPALVPRAWQFDFSYRHPQLIGVRTPNGYYQWYWYLAYKVTNNTRSDRMWMPEFVVATDEGDIVTAGRGIPASVFDAIKQKEGNPLLMSPVEVVDTLLQGEDFAMESVAIWPAFTGKDVDRMDVFVSGISGESQTIRDPLTDDPVILRKTLMLEYELRGTTAQPRDEDLVFVNEQWVMR